MTIEQEAELDMRLFHQELEIAKRDPQAWSTMTGQRIIVQLDHGAGMLSHPDVPITNAVATYIFGDKWEWRLVEILAAPPTVHLLYRRR